MSQFKKNQLVHTPDGLAKIWKRKGPFEYWVKFVADKSRIEVYHQEDLTQAIEGAPKPILVERAPEPDIGFRLTTEPLLNLRVTPTSPSPCVYCGELAKHYGRYDSHRDEYVNLCDDDLAMVEEANGRKRLIASSFEDQKALEAVRLIGKKKKPTRGLGRKVARVCLIGAGIGAPIALVVWAVYRFVL